jgi:hypothetical protein
MDTDFKDKWNIYTEWTEKPQVMKGYWPRFGQLYRSMKETSDCLTETCIKPRIWFPSDCKIVIINPISNSKWEETGNYRGLLLLSLCAQVFSGTKAADYDTG